MSAGRRQSAEPDADSAVRGDARALAVLAEEHKSLASARSLAYNEAFSRANMFLMFLSMSFVALAFLAQAIGFTQDFLTLSAVLLFFDFVVGVTTFVRLAGAAGDDLRAIHGMNRIRHGYLQIAPNAAPYITTGTNDDLPSIMQTYGYEYGRRPVLQDFGFGLSTSQGMVGIIMAMVGGALAGVVMLALGATGPLSLGAATAAAIVVFVAGARWALRGAAADRRSLPVLYPSQQTDTGTIKGDASG